MPDPKRTGRSGSQLKFVVAVAVVPVVGLLAACSQLEPVAPSEPVTDPTQLYAGLALDYPAVTLTTDSIVPAYHVLQLTATPYDASGTTIAGAPTATFVSLDTSAVTVTADGLLRARRAANQVRVVATLAIGNVRHTDTATVNVQSLAAANVPVLDTLSIHVPADSAVWYVPSYVGGQDWAGYLANISGTIPSNVLISRAVDDAGNPIDGMAVDYVSLDPTIALVDRHTGEVTLLKKGYVRVVARANAFGVVRADTMTYAVNAPFSADFWIGQQGFYYEPSVLPAVPALTIVAGGIVLWFQMSTVPVDINFDDPIHVVEPAAAFCQFVNIFGPGPYCGAGDIAGFTGTQDFPYGEIFLFPRSPDGARAWRFRQFPVPGTYTFRNPANGATGQVTVVEHLAPPP